MTSPVHPFYKLGLKPHGRDDSAFVKVRWRAGKVPTPPATCDYMTGVNPGLDKNDVWGICGPTSADNSNRITTKRYGHEVDAPQEDVNALYSAATDPPFDPTTGANDSGVMMPDLLGAMRTVGLGGKKIVGYGKLADQSPASIRAAIYLFGSVLFAVDLKAAQQAQTDQKRWEYVAGSSDWGGHAIVAGAYTAEGPEVFTWALRVLATNDFLAHQLMEVWVPIWPEVAESDQFASAVDVQGIADDFASLTGGTWPVPVPAPPAPTPTPTPPPAPTPTPDPNNPAPTLGRIVIYTSKIDNGSGNEVRSPAVVVRTKATCVPAVSQRWGPEPSTLRSARDSSVTVETSARPPDVAYVLEDDYTVDLLVWGLGRSYHEYNVKQGTGLGQWSWPTRG
jgi:hypothetical protein